MRDPSRASRPGPSPRRAARTRLRSTALALALASACGCGRGDAAARPPDVVVVLVDTLRADVLASYGGPVGEGGAIAGLAARGALFENAQAASPWTGPSVSSLLTGFYPDEIGIHDIADPLPRSVTNLAQRLRGAGYATGAVVSNNIAGPAYGHDKGYDRFVFGRYKDKQGDGPAAARPSFTADRVTDAALAWLSELPGGDRRPFFLYVHYTDPHEPYLPPEPFRSRFQGAVEPLPDEVVLERRYAVRPVRPEAVAAVRAAYQGEVAFADHEIGRLLAALPPDALVLLTADHGEEFLEHGAFFHGQSLYQELVHVPLVVAGPGIQGGRRVAALASHVDVVPTLLELCGVDSGGARFSGRSLAPLLRGEPSAEATVHSVLEQGAKRLLAARSGDDKLIEAPDDARRLFDLARDPRELRDVTAERAALAAELAARIAARRAAIVPLEDEPADPAAAEARERELRAIGYVK